MKTHLTVKKNDFSFKEITFTILSGISGEPGSRLRKTVVTQARDLIKPHKKGAKPPLYAVFVWEYDLFVLRVWGL